MILRRERDDECGAVEKESCVWVSDQEKRVQCIHTLRFGLSFSATYSSPLSSDSEGGLMR